ncbi:nuclease-related domain-containing protein [Haloechinothrix salitolerans]|uniref:Nuclease-related domain-containing protein n=1 Tax=Haloechinothrix salitolerans TaxID=926830 RepID=A0ABW2BX86_9PSEU
MGSTYRPPSWPIAPEQLPWWGQVEPETTCQWRNGRIRHAREMFFAASGLWAVFMIVLLTVQQQSPGELVVWLLWPALSIGLGIARVRIPAWLLATYLLSAGFLGVVAVYASQHANTDPAGTAAIFTLLAVFHAVVPLLARAYAISANADRTVPRQIRDQQVFGSTGTALARAQGWRREAVESGLLGEALTGELLEHYLTRIPSARIFHSLKWPGSSTADVDHAVLCGRRLILIDSKRWTPGNYTLTADNIALRAGRPFFGSEVRLPCAVAAYQRLLPRCDVHGIVLIHPNRNGAVTISAHPGAGVQALTSEQVLLDVCAWLAEQPYVIDTRAVALLKSMTHSCGPVTGRPAAGANK